MNKDILDYEKSLNHHQSNIEQIWIRKNKEFLFPMNSKKINVFYIQDCFHVYTYQWDNSKTILEFKLYHLWLAIKNYNN